MKHLRFLLFTVLAAARAASLAAQSPMPTVAPATMPASESAVPISSSGDAGVGSGPAAAGYSGVDFGGYCGDGYCNDGLCGPPVWGGGNLLCLTGRGYVQIDALLLNRNDAPPASIVTEGGVTQMAGNAPWFGFETLPRITTGYVLPNDTAVEATFLYKDDFDADFGVGRAGNTLTIAGDGNLYRRVNMELSTSIHSAEINLVETGRIFNYLAGFRWMEVQDHMWMSGANVAGTTANNTQINTYNTLLGGQSGGRMSISRGLFTLEGTGKAGLFYNQGISHSQTAIGAVAAPATVSKRSEGTCESFVGEIDAVLTYRPSAAVAVRFGYQVMWICNTAIAVDQFSTGGNVYNAVASASLNDHGDIFLHGPSAGLDVRW